LDLLTTSLDNSFPINLKTNIFPNPFYDQTNLVFELPTPQKIEVSLHDNLGKLIKVIDNGQKIKGTYNYTINGADIKPGMYFITLKSEAGKKSAKIVKQ
jgi:hypothetical protein